MSPQKKEARLALPATSGRSGTPDTHVARPCSERMPRLIDVGQYLQDRFHSKCLDIIDEAFAVARTAAELSNASTSAEIALRLKQLARSLKRSCNRLTYKLAKSGERS